ncbi:GNAT family N-acetyltransferase [Aliikangiella coralliicola]|uniref:GNAT family N-acetyltransferase n=1 Tax=Aliikangiella coralliicola TaxID=2592383 RepID=A0A545U665_9GAMM|nr:GNAT family N-acetyltransferase [Aliikangiella coralliicola]TQV84962.1 GNAT family N-acetyltransferase [Aliikangiella coralliicola]
MTAPQTLADAISSISHISTAVTFRHATTSDSKVIAQLVNSAYRGDSSRAGWTTEADLLEGTRITAERVEELIEVQNSLILLCLKDHNIVGCVHLQRNKDGCYLGMFVVKPELQGSGIGKTFLQAAESLVQNLWDIKKIWMTVIDIRTELIAFYERRGYCRTGKTKPFQSEQGNEVSLVDNLQFEELEKILPL